MHVGLQRLPVNNELAISVWLRGAEMRLEQVAVVIDVALTTKITSCSVVQSQTLTDVHARHSIPGSAVHLFSRTAVLQPAFVILLIRLAASSRQNTLFTSTFALKCKTNNLFVLH